jgi:hypothetical protein
MVAKVWAMVGDPDPHVLNCGFEAETRTEVSVFFYFRIENDAVVWI